MIPINKLREIRNSIGFSQEYVAKRLGVSQGMISGWENGVWPRADKLRPLAKLYGLTIEELLTAICGPDKPRKDGT